MAGGGPHFHNAPASVEGVADEGMTAVVDRQVALPFLPQHFAAALNRLRRFRRSRGLPSESQCCEHTKWASSAAPCSRRNRFHSTRSASVPASQVSGTLRALWPLLISRRTRIDGRELSTCTSQSVRPPISEARRPQHVGQAEDHHVHP